MAPEKITNNNNTKQQPASVNRTSTLSSENNNNNRSSSRNSNNNNNKRRSSTNIQSSSNNDDDDDDDDDDDTLVTDKPKRGPGRPRKEEKELTDEQQDAARYKDFDKKQTDYDKEKNALAHTRTAVKQQERKRKARAEAQNRHFREKTQKAGLLKIKNRFADKHFFKLLNDAHMQKDRQRIKKQFLQQQYSTSRKSPTSMSMTSSMLNEGSPSISVNDNSETKKDTLKKIALLKEHLAKLEKQVNVPASRRRRRGDDDLEAPSRSSRKQDIAPKQNDAHRYEVVSGTDDDEAVAETNAILGSYITNQGSVQAAQYVDQHDGIAVDDDDGGVVENNKDAAWNQVLYNNDNIAENPDDDFDDGEDDAFGDFLGEEEEEQDEEEEDEEEEDPVAKIWNSIQIADDDSPDTKFRKQREQRMFTQYTRNRKRYVNVSDDDEDDENDEDEDDVEIPKDEQYGEYQMLDEDQAVETLPDTVDEQVDAFNDGEEIVECAGCDDLSCLLDIRNLKSAIRPSTTASWCKRHNIFKGDRVSNFLDRYKNKEKPEKDAQRHFNEAVRAGAACENCGAVLYNKNEEKGPDGQMYTSSFFCRKTCSADPAKNKVRSKYVRVINKNPRDGSEEGSKKVEEKKTTVEQKTTTVVEKKKKDTKQVYSRIETYDNILANTTLDARTLGRVLPNGTSDADCELYANNLRYAELDTFLKFAEFDANNTSDGAWTTRAVATTNLRDNLRSYMEKQLRKAHSDFKKNYSVNVLGVSLLQDLIKKRRVALGELKADAEKSPAGRPKKSGVEPTRLCQSTWPYYGPFIQSLQGCGSKNRNPYNFLRFLAFVSMGISFTACQKLLDVADSTMKRWRETLLSSVYEYEQRPIAGGGFPALSIDETFVGHRKHHAGKRARHAHYWFVTVTEIDPHRANRIGRTIWIPVRDRSQKTMREILQKYSLGTNKSIVISDCWPGYSNLDEVLEVCHQLVNHSENFKDPETGVHNNFAENAHKVVKYFVKKFNYQMGRKAKNIQHHISLGTLFYKKPTWQERFVALLNCVKNHPYPMKETVPGSELLPYGADPPFRLVVNKEGCIGNLPWNFQWNDKMQERYERWATLDPVKRQDEDRQRELLHELNNDFVPDLTAPFIVFPGLNLINRRHLHHWANYRRLDDKAPPTFQSSTYFARRTPTREDPRNFIPFVLIVRVSALQNLGLERLPSAAQESTTNMICDDIMLQRIEQHNNQLTQNGEAEACVKFINEEEVLKHQKALAEKNDDDDGEESESEDIVDVDDDNDDDGDGGADVEAHLANFKENKKQQQKEQEYLAHFQNFQNNKKSKREIDAEAEELLRVEISEKSREFIERLVHPFVLDKEHCVKLINGADPFFEQEIVKRAKVPRETGRFFSGIKRVLTEMKTRGEYVESLVVEVMMALIREKFHSVLLENGGSLCVLSPYFSANPHLLDFQRINEACEKRDEEKSQRLTFPPEIVGVFYSGGHFNCYRWRYLSDTITIYESMEVEGPNEARNKEFNYDSDDEQEAVRQKYLPFMTTLEALNSNLRSAGSLPIEIRVSTCGEVGCPFPRQGTNDCYLASTNRLISFLSAQEDVTTAYSGLTTRQRVGNVYKDAVSSAETKEGLKREGIATRLRGVLYEYLPEVMFGDN